MTPASAEPAFVTRIRLRARRCVLWLRQVWSSTPSNLGLAISHEEVDRILLDEQPSVPEPAEEARNLSASIAEADRATAADARLQRIKAAFELGAAEIDLLTLAVAVEIDPWLRRAFGYIHDDATACYPTQWLARQLFQWDPSIRIQADAPLAQWRLARPADGQPSPWSVTASWVIDPAIATMLLAGDAIDPMLGAAAALIATGTVPPCIYPDELAMMQRFITVLAPASHGSPIEIVLHGATGAGKRTLAAQLCDALKLPLLVVDCSALIVGQDAPAARELVLRAQRSARLAGAALYWHDADGAPPTMCSATVPLSLFAMSGRAPFASHPRALRRTIFVPALTRAARVALWEQHAPLPAPQPVIDCPLVVADIVRAAAVAPAGPEAIADACRGTLDLDASAMATRLPLPYEWNDLVLPRHLREHLEEFAAQIRQRWTVYEQWGFGRFYPLGRGISALFAGPSGTGKTMAAQVIARELGMEIYRIDLASVVNKYIGETEKNLRRVFDACERANVLLFFDEADALFGQRMRTKDAHDRFANIEIDYLLQRMEQFEGVAVLATNRKSEIDTAFLRRLRFIVDFQPPGPEERRDLWTRALLPRGDDGTELLAAIDYDALAEKLDMTGADIKNAATSAAFLARSENRMISMKHVYHAARRELAKQGVALRNLELEG